MSELGPQNNCLYMGAINRCTFCLCDVSILRNQARWFEIDFDRKLPKLHIVCRWFLWQAPIDTQWKNHTDLTVRKLDLWLQFRETLGTPVPCME